jgi:hypothetical protein
MKHPESRHLTEEELLMHYLQEETANSGREIAAHLRDCGECSTVYEEYRNLVEKIQAWPVPDPPDETWRAQKAILLAHYRQDRAEIGPKGFLHYLRKSLPKLWNYALENPLPTLAYVTVAIAFAMERTISAFRLEQILPGASEVFEILRQVL